MSGAAPGVRPVILAVSIDPDRLGKLFGVFSSDFDGEILVPLANEYMQAGLSWEEILTPAPERTTAVLEFDFGDIAGTIELCLENARVLQDWGTGFIRSIRDRPVLGPVQRRLPQHIAAKATRAADARAAPATRTRPPKSRRRRRGA